MDSGSARRPARNNAIALVNNAAFDRCLHREIRNCVTVRSRRQSPMRRIPEWRTHVAYSHRLCGRRRSDGSGTGDEHRRRADRDECQAGKPLALLAGLRPPHEHKSAPERGDRPRAHREQVEQKDSCKENGRSTKSARKEHHRIAAKPAVEPVTVAAVRADDPPAPPRQTLLQRVSGR